MKETIFCSYNGQELFIIERQEVGTLYLASVLLVDNQTDKWLSSLTI